MDKLAFAARLKAVREARGFTQQKDLEDAAGIPRGRVSNWELGYNWPNIPALMAIAQTLGCSVDALLGCTGYDITNKELAHLLKYRDLDETGRDAVEAVLDSQLRRIRSDG